MSEPAAKKRAHENGDGKDDDSKDAYIKTLESRLDSLETLLEKSRDNSTTYFASRHARKTLEELNTIPAHGVAASHVAEMIEQIHQTDFQPRLNTSSYVNVVSEREEKRIAMLGAEVNLADGNVYPASVKLHDSVVNMIAKMWNAPPPKVKGGNYCGSGTVGSTEACLLAGLALKFRWRRWYAKKLGVTPCSAEVKAVCPNLVITTCYQAAWEKFFRYFEVTAKFAKPKLVDGLSMAVDAKELADLCDDHTIGVVAVLGNHYNGAYDPVWDIDKEVRRVNKERGLQVGIHIDAASGGFIAPFQDGMEDKPFDFRLESVLSMSASGHKFGESVCGTGWVVFRQREDLAEHIAVSVTYLGGHSDSMTLNFSRPASAAYVQFYKLLRLGMEGYRQKVHNQMQVAKYLRKFLRDIKDPNGKPRFQMLDGGDQCCLPVVAARLHPDCHLAYDDIDLQHALAESHWYVSGYTLGFENFCNDGEEEGLCTDTAPEETMFRIVCKSNLTMGLAEELSYHFGECLPVLDSMQEGYSSMKSARAGAKADQVEIAEKKGIDMKTAINAYMAAAKWLDISKDEKEEEKKVEETPERKRRRRSSSLIGGRTPNRRGSFHTVC